MARSCGFSSRSRRSNSAQMPAGLERATRWCGGVGTAAAAEQRQGVGGCVTVAAPAADVGAARTAQLQRALLLQRDAVNSRLLHFRRPPAAPGASGERRTVDGSVHTVIILERAAALAGRGLHQHYRVVRLRQGRRRAQACGGPWAACRRQRRRRRREEQGPRRPRRLSEACARVWESHHAAALRREPRLGEPRCLVSDGREQAGCKL